MESSRILAQCLELPRDVLEYAGPLARQVVKNCRTDTEKTATIRDYFQKNHRYQIGVPFQDCDPLREFLTKKTPAHCEFFATGMVALLRAEHIPARYMAGFLVDEYNPRGRYYVVRAMHAHAWVETWLPGHGWVSFDPTPPGALPHQENAIC